MLVLSFGMLEENFSFLAPNGSGLTLNEVLSKPGYTKEGRNMKSLVSRYVTDIKANKERYFGRQLRRISFEAAIVNVRLDNKIRLIFEGFYIKILLINIEVFC